jgi:hypothetical protein
MADAGTTVTLKTTPDANVVTYGAILERIPGGVVTKWIPQPLEDAGGSEILGPAQGHNLIVFPVIKPGTNATMSTTISFSDGQTKNDTIQMTDNEPFGWRIFMT